MDKPTAGHDGNVNIWDFVGMVDGYKLQEIIDASGKKRPVWKKLVLRLHYELRFPLTADQAKKIKVEPWIPEGWPGGPVYWQGGGKVLA